MANLVRPELSELKFRKKLHESANTMSYAGGIEPFPKEEWKGFYQKYVEADEKQYLYRLIFCPACNDFTGEAGWQYSAEHERYEIFLLVISSLRRQGYGRKGINLLKKEAQANGIDHLYAVVEKTNPAVGFFEHLALDKDSEDDKTVTFRI